jgi:hypothetical protein
VSKAFHRDAGHDDFNASQSCQVGCMFFEWYNILDSHGKLLSVNNPAALQFLTQTGSKALGSFVLPIHQLNHTIMSQGLKILL